QVVEDSLGRLAAFPDRRHDEIRASNHITPGKDFLVCGLEGITLLRSRHHPAGFVRGNALAFDPVRRAGAETKRDQHRICRQNFLAAWNRLRTTTAIDIGLTETGFYDFHAGDLAILTNDFDGL